MQGLKRFVRTTPVAFWIALLGALFSIALYVSGLFGEETPFALLYMLPAFLTVAVLTAFKPPILRVVAAVIAGLMALGFAGLAVVFATSPDQAAAGDIPSLVTVHTTSMLLAGAAAVTDFIAAMRHRRTGRRVPG